MSSGVRNLRAMFENQGAASSPEPRDRSPVESASVDSSTRPTATVRASFVSVVPGAQLVTDLGTTKGTPSNSISANRRESFSIGQDNVEEAAELKKIVSQEKEERRQSEAVSETVPEQAVASRESSIPAPPIRNPPDGDMPNLGTIMKGSDFPESSTEAQKPKAKEASVQPKQGPVKAQKPPLKETLAKLVKDTEKPQVKDTPTKIVKEVEKPQVKDTPAKTAKKTEKAQVKATPSEPVKEAKTPQVESIPAEPTKEAEKAPVKDAPVEPVQEAEKPQPKEIAAESAKETEKPQVEETPAQPEQSPAKIEPTPVPVVVEQPVESSDNVAAETEDNASAKADAPTKSAVSDNKVQLPATNLHASSSKPTNGTPKATESKAKANGTPVAKKVEPKKPAPISTAKVSPTKASAAKSPLPKAMPRTPTTPKLAAPKPATPKPATPKPATLKPATTGPAAKPSPAAKVQPKPAAPKEPVKAPVAKTSRTSLRPAASATAPTSSAAAKTKSVAPETKKPAPTKPSTTAPRVSTSPTRFKKPRPKSPTRPVGLPSRLTAPTAASAAKHGEEQKIVRKPSTTTRPPPKAAAAKPSRASIAPGTSAPKRPESRTSTAGGQKEGFLERMMRPTASSNSKTHEKPASPPRKGATKTPASSALHKGKKKVEEVASKAKQVVTNGQHDDVPKADGEAAKDSSATDPVTEPEASHELTTATTPVQEADSSTAELQTPRFEGETLR
ncbi:hypothetical protein BKA66DRAFT_449057 [Pyrenochaeta sp. MPI-SDFR-AT-0127]|nr:hypothetical protein BKA66DRAFT_449057 [Pyrenochaeta sp. MPI-SDFR-AT-0127]